MNHYVLEKYNIEVIFITQALPEITALNILISKFVAHNVTSKTFIKFTIVFFRNDVLIIVKDFSQHLLVACQVLKQLALIKVSPRLWGQSQCLSNFKLQTGNVVFDAGTYFQRLMCMRFISFF